MSAPLAGPLDAPPAVSARQAQDALNDALSGLQLGVWDRQVRDFVGLADPAYVATIAAWVERAAGAIG